MHTSSWHRRSSSSKSSKEYLLPFVLVTSLFFMWGLSYGLLDVLNSHFQETLNITKSRSTLLQAAYFGAYFIIALPAGMFMKRFGYKKGIITGLICYATGAFLFYPAAEQGNFNFFLLALFILASGLTFLETAANPYVTVLGTNETAAFRLNLSQSFNGVGSFIGPLIAGQLFFSDGNSKDLASVQSVYLVIGGVVLFIALMFLRTPLPEIKEINVASDKKVASRSLGKHPNFIYAVITQFFYVAAQVGVAALFINYCKEAGVYLNAKNASILLSFGLGLFTIGRFAGTALMRRIPPQKLLTAYALINIILCAVVVWGEGWLSIYSLLAIFFFESIMFPTIFALGIKDLGYSTKRGSSFIIMSIVGGALVPYLMGLLSEERTANAYIVPLFCFLIVAWYGARGYKTH